MPLDRTVLSPPGAGAGQVLHAQEHDRLESLRSYGMLDHGADEDFDALTMLAAMTCDAPVALVSLLDEERLWFVSRFGIDAAESPRSALTCCSRVVAEHAPLTVRDLGADRRFAADPHVVSGRARSYAGVPLTGRDGLPLGTLCVVDRVVRSWSIAHLAALRSLARQAVSLLELRRLDARLGNLPVGPNAPLARPARLREALEREQLLPWFQPVVDLASGRATGVEALLRWQHPLAGTLTPAEFLPAVESTGLILPVGRHVLRQSLRLLADLPATDGTPQPTVAVNVSPTQLSEAGLADDVVAALDEHGVPPERLTVELTESAALVDHAVARRELGRLRELGVGLALDDYGTGWSGLQRVLTLPLTSVKIDRSIVQQLTGDGRVESVLQHLVRCFQELGLSVVAEGVETAEQERTLRELGCDSAQGYRFGAAEPAAVVAERLRTWPAPLDTGGGGSTG